MAFFDKIGEIAKNVGDKASDTVEITKLNSRIKTEEATIGGLEKQLGRYFYAKFQGGEQFDFEAVGICDGIKKSEAAIAELQAQIAAIKADNEQPAAPKAAEPAPQFCFCTECGTKNPAGTKFCGNCGKAL